MASPVVLNGTIKVYKTAITDKNPVEFFPFENLSIVGDMYSLVHIIIPASAGVTVDLTDVCLGENNQFYGVVFAMKSTTKVSIAGMGHSDTQFRELFIQSSFTDDGIGAYDFSLAITNMNSVNEAVVDILIVSKENV